MMRTSIVGLSVLSLLAATPAVIARSVADAEARPIAVLLRVGGWTGSADSPLFVLYDDGRAVYPRDPRNHDSPAYRAARLPHHDRDELLRSVGIGAGFFRLDASYTASAATDRESLVLLVWRGDELTPVSVYGGEDAGMKLSSSVPAPFRAAVEQMTAFHAADAVPWEPRVEREITDVRTSSPVVWLAHAGARPGERRGIDTPMTRVVHSRPHFPGEQRWRQALERIRI